MQARHATISVIILLSVVPIACFGTTADNSGSKQIINPIARHAVTEAPEERLARKLLKAVADNDLGKVAHLIETRHANVNATDKAGRTVLHIAAQSGFVEMINYLAPKISNINARTTSNITALGLAIQNNHAACVIALLTHHAATDLVTVSDDISYGAINLAVFCCNAAMIDVLVPHIADIDMPVKGHTPLMVAIDKDGFDSVLFETLISHGANIHACDNDGLTPLHWACKRRNEYAITRLLELGASPHAKTKELLTKPLAYAIIAECPATIIKLIREAVQAHPEKPTGK